MIIKFQGNGGGGFVFTTNELKYEGFWIYDDVLFIVDPGDFNYRKFNWNGKVIVYISHSHLDHAFGVFKIIEYFRRFLKRKIDYLIIPKSLIECRELIRLNEEFISNVKEVIEHKNKIEVENHILKLTKTFNHADDNYGFILDNKIGYTSDTKYNEELIDEFKKVDILIMNVCFFLRKENSYHLNLIGLENLYNKTNAKLYIMHHFCSKKWYLESFKYKKDNLIPSREGLEIRWM